jgi:hypothetical protein
MIWQIDITMASQVSLRPVAVGTTHANSFCEQILFFGLFSITIREKLPLMSRHGMPTLKRIASLQKLSLLMFRTMTSFGYMTII